MMTFVSTGFVICEKRRRLTLRRIAFLLCIICLAAVLHGCGAGGAASTDGATTPPVTNNPGQAATIALTSSNRVVNTGNAIPLTARALDSAGNGVSGIAIVFTSTGVGTTSANYQLTDVNGNATITIFSSSAGSATVNAFSNTLSSSLSVYFVNGAIKNQLAVSVDSNGNNVYDEPSDFTISGTSGNPVKLRLTFTDAGGAPLSGKTITLSSDSNLVSFSSSSLTTDGNGTAYSFATVTDNRNTVFADITATASDGTARSATLKLQPFIIGDIQFYADNYSLSPGDTAKLTACPVSSSGPVQVANLQVNFSEAPASSGQLLPFAFTDTTGCTTNNFAAVNTGSVTITASFAGASRNITLNVSKAPQPPQTLQATPSSPSIPVGSSQLIMITGGLAPYTITSLNPDLTNPASWTVMASGGTFQVTALKAGTATIIISDSAGTQIQVALTITVSPSQPLQVTPSSATLTVGQPQVIVVTGGTSPYTATSLSPSITNQALWNIASSGGSFQVTGTNPGTATINITDSAGAQVQAVLTITGTTTLPLTATPATVSLFVGQPQVVVITGGTPPYTAQSLNPSLIDPSSWSVTSSGGSFQFTGTNPGTATINVVDSRGSQMQVTVNITNTVTTSLTTTPSTVSLVVGEPQIIVITGGTPPYAVTSLNPSLTNPTSWTVTSSGGSFQVTPTAAGSALINIVDSKGTQIQATLTIQ